MVNYAELAPGSPMWEALLPHLLFPKPHWLPVWRSARTVRQSARHSNTTQPHADNAELPICPCTRAIKGYAVLAIALARGDEIDRSLAINVTRVVSQMMSEDKANQPQLAKVKKTVEKRGLSQCVKGPSSASALDR